MSVTWMHTNPVMASARYRALMPAAELQAMGIGPGRDVLVAGKHGWDWDAVTRGYRRVVYDVCNDRFESRDREFYLSACARADAVVAASEEMARRVKRHTGRTAWVIPDPYEERLGEPHISARLLWHGHMANAHEILPWVQAMPEYAWSLVTGGAPQIPPGFEPWSLRRMDVEFSACGLIVLPYIGHPESTANRAINAIRRGLFPVCGPLPALGELGAFQGHVGDGVRWALAHEAEALKRVKSMQEYVSEAFAPRAIAMRWKDMLESL